MNSRFSVFLLVILCGCAGAAIIQPTSSRSIELSQLETIQVGKTTETEVLKVFGQPNDVIPLKRDLAGKVAWIYLIKGAQKLSLLVDSKSGTVSSASWIPDDSDPLKKKDVALSHFGAARFSESKVGSVSNDYYSDDSIFSDRQNGISIYVNGSNNLVDSISFTEPKRGLAKD